MNYREKKLWKITVIYVFKQYNYPTLWRDKEKNKIPNMNSQRVGKLTTFFQVHKHDAKGRGVPKNKNISIQQRWVISVELY